MDLAGFTDIKEPFLAMSLMVIRPMAVFSVVPFMSTSTVTGTVRNVMVFALTLFLFPLLFPMLVHHEYVGAEVLWVAVKEALVGVLFGFLASGPFWIAEGVGFLVDNQRGTTMASIFNPFSGNTTSPIGVLMDIVIDALFFQTGAFLVFLSLFYGSYLTWPILAFLPSLPANFSIFFLDFVDHVERSMVLYAAPMVIVMFMTDFGLGLVNRFAPQLNVFFMSMPIKSALSLIILIFYMAYFLAFIEEEFLDSFEVIRFFQQMIPVTEYTP